MLPTDISATQEFCMYTEKFSSRTFRPEWLIFLAGVAFCLTQLAISFSNPIMEQYSFRQTQTAISTYWMIKGGPWVAYQTPVIGSPWSLPFEFPFYQWVVAVIAKLMSFLSLDEAGRVVSEIFFLCALWPLWRITSHHRQGHTLFLISAGVLMCSPIYAFWSRGFMMESAALFFSIWFVAALTDFLTKPSACGFAEMALTAILAAGIKITTFVGFSFAGALITLYFMYRDRAAFTIREQIAKYVCVSLAIALSIFAVWGWVYYSDALKSENLVGRLYTGQALKTWNFGTSAQRKSLALLQVIFVRAPSEALGSWSVVAAATTLALANLKRVQLLIYFSLITLYVAPFFIFTNLHLVHHYYQYANSIFLVLAVGYIAYALGLKNRYVSYAFLALIFSGQMYGYLKYFHQDLVLPNREQQLLVADNLRSNTRSEDVFVGFGLDWSSEVPYYAERRALLVPDAVSTNVLNAFASNPRTYTGGEHIGAVVVCPNDLSTSSEKKASYALLLNTVKAGLRPHYVGYCVVFS
jgi:hypothetical protein